MTLPDERLRALRETKKFLSRLLDPKLTPRVPSSIRSEAGGLLKHFPDSYIIDQIPEYMNQFFNEYSYKLDVK